MANIDAYDAKAKFQEAYKLIEKDSTTLEKLESARVLLKGLNPKVDALLEKCFHEALRIENIKKGEVLEATLDVLPENTKEEKKRKKAIIFFLQSLKELKEEVERVRAEFESYDNKSGRQQTQSLAKIFSFAKGPYGIITLLALVIAGALIFSSREKGPTQRVFLTPTSSPHVTASPPPTPVATPTAAPVPVQKTKIQVITFGGRQIPLSELEVRTGPDCTNSPQEAAHYHAKNNTSVRATDGTIINDLGACAFGKIRDVPVLEIDSP